MKNQLLLFVALAIFTSCTEDELDQEGCPRAKVCTDIFKSVVIQLTNPQDQPYLLDNFEVIKLSTGQKVINKNPETDSIMKKNGLYRILDDISMNETTRKGLDFQFTGFKGGNVKVQKTITVSHDCCHVVSESHLVKVVIPD